MKIAIDSMTAAQTFVNNTGAADWTWVGNASAEGFAKWVWITVRKSTATITMRS